MPLPREIKAVATILSDPQNAELTAEEVAEKAIEVLDELRSKTDNLIVLGHFRINEDESYVAAVGPLSTRATARARGVGEHFAWDYKTRKGTGKFVLVPLIRDPREAWDHLRKEQRPPLEVQQAFGEMPYYATGVPYSSVPACICGVKLEREQLIACPRHPGGSVPKGEEGDS